MSRIVCLSDTHNSNEQIDVPSKLKFAVPDDKLQFVAST